MSFGLLCLAFIVIRVMEKAFSYIIGKIPTFPTWFTFWKKSEPKKQYFYKRIVAIVTPELHARVKAHVLLLNCTITEYILMAVTEKLKRESHG